MSQDPSKRGRKVGYRSPTPAKVYLGLRLPKEVIEFYTNNYPNRQAKIREVLINYIKEQQDGDTSKVPEQ